MFLPHPQIDGQRVAAVRRAEKAFPGRKACEGAKRPMGRWLVFLVGSVPILWVSRASLRNRNAHGFHRFFAFEAILGLIALNLPAWFRDPFSRRQLASWALLAGSLGLAVHGFHLLHRAGRPDLTIEDPTRLGIEKTTRLVRSGAYRTIRHPLYASLLALAWGVFLKAPSRLSLALAAVATGAITVTARVEERENLRGFGAEYAGYLRETRMFIPFVF
jgi:protein-S-isoprenylcysteine O-methyltransferase Ste14